MRCRFQSTALSPLLILFIVCFFSLEVHAQCGTAIAVFPYHEDFEASTGGWTSGGMGNDWAWGAPNKPTINTAGSGNNCWVTGGLNGSFYALGERSYVESPCFDFTQLSNPFIRFKIWWESERQYDGATFQYSLDGGAIWTNLGNANEPGNCLNDNWFNTSSITNLANLAIPRHGWSGNIQSTAGSCQGGGGSGDWVTASHCLEELAGKPNVRFRFAFGAGTACNDFDGIAFDDVHIENAPAITASFNTACAGNNGYAFTDLSTLCPDTWHWDFGDPGSGTSNGSSLQNPTHVFSKPGLFMVTLQASSACSGAATVTFPVEVLGLDANITMPSCYGGRDGSASIQSVPATDDPVYLWSTTPPQSGATVTHLSAGDYTVTVNATGFCPVTAMVSVAQPDSLFQPSFNVVQAVADTTTIVLGSTISLTGIVDDPGSIIAYDWTPSAYLDCDSCLNTLASPLQTTDYTLSARDTNGCFFYDALTIRVLLGSVYIPNVFRPSSDQFNDHFTVFGARDVEQVELLQIYDRWGSLVFENTNFPASDPALGWDGFINGKEAAPGVYLYVLSIRFLNKSIQKYSGNVTVIR